VRSRPRAHDGDRIAIGDFALECIATPRHARGYLSFRLEHEGRRNLFGGDIVIRGGTILL
jgi:glyoxylase-like metal-dependent hydrolase (beta-lactamase superfamily II)